jgi:hypothetical protein
LEAELRRCLVRRTLTLVVLVALVSLVPASSASAGGSWIYPDRGAYVPGDLARLHGGFSPNGAYVGTIADGPYIAYLLPQGTSIERTKVPPSAISLGELRIVRAHYETRAIVTFSVPDIPTGWYHVGYCNDPCTVDGIGDLIGSWRFVVAPTRLEGKHIVQIDRLENRIASVARKVHAHARVEQKKLERALETRTAELQDARGRIATIESEMARLRRRTGDGPVVPGWSVALLAAALMAIVIVLRRKRAPRLVVPDSVPDDLGERDRAGV